MSTCLSPLTRSTGPVQANTVSSCIFVKTTTVNLQKDLGRHFLGDIPLENDVAGSGCEICLQASLNLEI